MHIADDAPQYILSQEAKHGWWIQWKSSAALLLKILVVLDNFRQENYDANC